MSEIMTQVVVIYLTEVFAFTDKPADGRGRGVEEGLTTTYGNVSNTFGHTCKKARVRTVITEKPRTCYIL